MVDYEIQQLHHFSIKTQTRTHKSNTRANKQSQVNINKIVHTDNDSNGVAGGGDFVGIAVVVVCPVGIASEIDGIDGAFGNDGESPDVISEGAITACLGSS